ncbi:MAG: cupredoxin domain-containing protein [Gemmatimonadota bacterium]
MDRKKDGNDMKRMLRTGTALLLSLAFIACGGGGDQAAAGGEEGEAAGTSGEEQTAEITVPDWMTVDEEAQTVTIDLVAGETDDNNSWNYNGYYNGNVTIVVPEGFEVTIDFENADQVNPHSVGVDDQVGDYPSTFDEVEPAFEGAVTEGAAEMATSTQPGESESITFTASEAGEYALVCYVPAHAVTGMWIGFEVSADGEAGVREEG